MSMSLRSETSTLGRVFGLWLCLLLLLTPTSLGKARKRSCTLCEQDSLVDVVVPENEALLKDLTALAEGAGSTIEILEDGRGYRTQLSMDTIKTLSRRGVQVLPWDEPQDDPIEKDGETCQEAITAELGVTYTGQVTNDVPWVWYSFTPTASGVYRITTAGSDFDTILYVYDGCAGNMINFNDDFGWEFTSELTLALEAESTYFIHIESYFYTAGSYTLLIEETESVPGQLCQDAFVAELGETYVGETTATATQRWYSFTPETAGMYEISLAGSDFDTTLAVYDECGGNQIAYNDEDGALSTSRVVVQMEAETTYYIQIDGFWSLFYGNYVLFIDEYIPIPGESCLFPLEAELNTLYEGTITASMPQIWYTFTPTASGDYVIDLKGSVFDTVLGVYDRCNGYAVGYNDDTNDWQSRLSMYMHEGTTYYIQIATWGDLGLYNLKITPVTEPAPHDTVAGATPVTIASSVHGCTDAATSSLSSSSCGGYDSRDVWHSFKPAMSSFVRLTLKGHDFDTTLSVFDEDSGVELACNDQKDDCTNDSGLSMEMVQGKSYLIRVAGYYDGTGHYTLTLEQAFHSAPPAPQSPSPADGIQEVAHDIVLSWNNWVVPSVMQQTRQVNAGKGSDARGIKGIYGRDDRLDEYQVTEANILNAGNATVILMPKDLLTSLPRTNQYLLNDTMSLGELISYYYGLELCPDEPFQNQPSPGVCSGFLVAPDLIVTAGHCVGCEGDIQELAAVFGFIMTDANTAVIQFEPEDVYFCQEQVVGQYGVPDWSLVRLDRPVTGHVPLRLRRTGKVAERQSLLMAGHPLGLPRKYDMGATVQGNWEQSYFSANTDSFGGNSGSAVFNLDTLEVEGILVWGNGDFGYNDEIDCVQSGVCPDSGCPTWEYATRIGLLSAAVPCYDVFFGSDPDHLTQVDSGWAAPQFKPEGLEPGQTYYWRVISRNAAGQTLGPIWSFTTAQ